MHNIVVAVIDLTPEFLDRLVEMSPADRIRLARQMPIEQKLLLGGLLFDRDCAMMESLVRRTFPAASDEIVRALMRESVRRL